MERLGNHALSCECGIAVNQYRKDRIELLDVEEILLCADDSFEDRVDRLEVGWVGSKIDLRRRTGFSLEDTFSAEVILHIAGTMDFILRVVTLELLEDLAVGLTRDIGKDIESTTMWHTDAGLVETGLCC